MKSVYAFDLLTVATEPFLTPILLGKFLYESTGAGEQLKLVEDFDIFLFCIEFIVPLKWFGPFLRDAI
jgi:hypothetical protein